MSKPLSPPPPPRPIPPSPPPGWYPAPSGRSGQRWWDGHAWSTFMWGTWRQSGLIIGGIVCGTIGAGLWILAAQPHAECSSGLGQIAQAFSSQAASDCRMAGFVYVGAILLMVVGAILLLVGVAELSSHRGPFRPPAAAPPGWYPDPDVAHLQRWWTGRSWSDYRRPPPP
jgi:hypothetical protein